MSCLSQSNLYSQILILILFFLLFYKDSCTVLFYFFINIFLDKRKHVDFNGLISIECVIFLIKLMDWLVRYEFEKSDIEDKKLSIKELVLLT